MTSCACVFVVLASFVLIITLICGYGGAFYCQLVIVIKYSIQLYREVGKFKTRGLLKAKPSYQAKPLYYRSPLCCLFVFLFSLHNFSFTSPFAFYFVHSFFIWSSKLRTPLSTGQPLELFSQLNSKKWVWL